MRVEREIAHPHYFLYERITVLMIDFEKYMIATESLKIYDKAAWHIDGGERADRVLKSLKEDLQFLHDNNMLTPEGEEIYKAGVDTSYSLHERMVNRDGKKFLESKYSGKHTST